MELLYISTFMFTQDMQASYGLPSCADSFFEKYLGVFDSVRVLGEPLKAYLDRSALVSLKNPRICVEILPPNTRPKDFVHDTQVKKLLKEKISRADAILIKPASRRGMMAIHIAERLNKPYMIEMTGDIHNALMQSPSKIKRLYAPLLYHQITKTIKKCSFGLYVSEDYLQRKYPISGKICGCADVVLEPCSSDVLTSRMHHIEKMDSSGTIRLALVGFYQGNGKGVDTALRALARLPENYHLSVLGNGTEENQEKWYLYGEKHGVTRERLQFPKPLPSASAVLQWLDGYDFFIFPTRSEGLGRAVVEAMSRGMPCFATDICTMPELLPQECLFKLDDDPKLAELLQKYTNSKELMLSVAQRNFEQAKKYDYTILKERRDAFLTEFRDFCLSKKKVRSE